MFPSRKNYNFLFIPLEKFINCFRKGIIKISSGLIIATRTDALAHPCPCTSLPYTFTSLLLNVHIPALAHPCPCTSLPLHFYIPAPKPAYPCTCKSLPLHLHIVGRLLWWYWHWYLSFSSILFCLPSFSECCEWMLHEKPQASFLLEMDRLSISSLSTSCSLSWELLLLVEFWPVEHASHARDLGSKPVWSGRPCLKSLRPQCQPPSVISHFRWYVS